MYQCKVCTKNFDERWKAEIHSDKVHNCSKKYNHLKVGNKWLCVICKFSAETKHLLKTHIFQQHTEVEVYKLLDKSIDEYIGLEKITRLRVVAFNSIASEKYDGYIFSLLGYSE